MKLSLKPFSKGLRSLEAEPQVARRNGRNPLLIFALAKINKMRKKKRRPQTAQSLERPTIRLVFPFLFVLIETRVGHRVSKGNSGLCGVRLRALP
ncbi:hypothetical protein B5F17_08105 [Butyricicoccus pullicaecorum]|uniref:Uncharacterized protein n=1 Tax=Butyricicoccus pullicaecorum TaxID=501571 RepID=A0A1Y4LAY5_9FIRM|nr:hypothetical protein [Butyricicoccus pullicaecorum]OUP52659.1 hypothetical protein B5F17_08105 [Butyricicoccus pullicaecorum]